MNASNIITLIISVLALVISFVAGQRSIQATRAASMLALVGTVFARRNQPEFVTAMTEIRADDFGRGVDPARGFSGLPEPVRSHAYLVSNFFDDMGKLIAHKVMKEDIIIGTYGQAGLYAWQALQPYVEGQRVLNRSNFQIYFEYLSKRVVARPPDSIHRKLKIL